MRSGTTLVALRRRTRATVTSLLILAAASSSLVTTNAIQIAERDAALARLNALGANATEVSAVGQRGELIDGAAGRAAEVSTAQGALVSQTFTAEAKRSSFDAPTIVTPVLGVRAAGDVLGLDLLAGRSVLTPKAPTATAGRRAAEVLGIDTLPALVDIAGLKVTVTGIIAGDPVKEILNRGILLDLSFARSHLTTTQQPTLLVRSRSAVSPRRLEAAANPLNPEVVAAQPPEALVAARSLAESSAGNLARVLGGALAGAGALIIGLTLFSSARARSHELAVRRVFGASRFQLALMPTLEAAVIGVVGGTVGVALGEAAAAIWSHRIGALYSFDPMRGILAIVLTSVAAIVASLPPAIYASRIDPVDALAVE